MNKTKIFIIAIITATTLSCLKDDILVSDCDCIKTTYEIESYTYFVNGLPHLGTRYNILTEEPVGCLEETNEMQSIGNGLFIEINCN